MFADAELDERSCFRYPAPARKNDIKFVNRQLEKKETHRNVGALEQKPLLVNGSLACEALLHRLHQLHDGHGRRPRECNGTAIDVVHGDSFSVAHGCRGND